MWIFILLAQAFKKNRVDIFSTLVPYKKIIKSFHQAVYLIPIGRVVAPLNVYIEILYWQFT